MLTRFTELLDVKSIFVRERKPTWMTSLGILLIYVGLSCRQAAEFLRFFDNASYEAVR